MDFTHLHLHSEYSLLDGINRFKPLIQKAKDSSMSAMAITDHGNLFGSLSFYKECNKQDIKPIIGIEAYITYDKDGLENPEKTRDNHHMILLAKNNKGLENLFWLTSNAWLHNFYYNPRVYIKHLEDHSEGLIATSSCLGGIIAKLASFDDGPPSTEQIEAMDKAICYYKEVFGSNFYLEIQDHDMKAQEIFNHYLISRSKKFNLSLVIAADAHFLNKEDHDLHAHVMAMQFKKTIDEYRNNECSLTFEETLFVRTPREMYEAAKKWGVPEAFENASRIASECDINIELGKYHMPSYNIDAQPDRKDFEQWKTSHTHLINECNPYRSR